jgi:ribosomal 30S subunit maturation factor RimM
MQTNKKGSFLALVDMKKSQYLECGKIVNTHGIRGGVKLESWCDTPDDLASLKKVFFKRVKNTFATRLKGHQFLSNLFFLSLKELLI